MKNNFRGAWVTKLVKHLTLDHDHDLMVPEFKPLIGLCTDSVEPALDYLSPPLCPFPTHSLSLKINAPSPLTQNKQIKALKKERKIISICRAMAKDYSGIGKKTE